MAKRSAFRKKIVFSKSSIAVYAVIEDMKEFPLIINLFKFLIDLLFPQECCLCGDQLLFNSGNKTLLCNICLSKIGYSQEKRCIKCSSPLISEISLCMRCRNENYFFNTNYSIFRYRTEIRELIRLYKFQKEKSLAYFFTEEISKVYFSLYNGIPIVPVPFRRKSKKKRGWDQIEVITVLLEKRWKIPVNKLLRRKGKQAQKLLNYSQRLTNLKGNISLAKEIKNIPEKVVLLDDIFTTGVTTGECSRVLKEAGVEIVYVLTIAMDL